MESPYFDIDCIMLSATPHIPRTRDFTGPPDADFSMVKSEDGQMPDHMFYGQCSETASRDRDKPYPAYNSIPVSSRTGEINPLARKYLNETETLLPYKKSTCNYSITRKPYYHDALHKFWAPITGPTSSQRNDPFKGGMIGTVAVLEHHLTTPMPHG
ncbi:predicted protein [Histoplasma capsulatum var. duboisii H88]|uniref:Predicted protein n=1 Tax=Ajellomyces capsulatus (strain H88) TaxID=544711 RepID=F0US37_AJEC8|nr:predicted protein [Histoplasma capsulatum var. duboisii H88]